MSDRVHLIAEPTASPDTVKLVANRMLSEGAGESFASAAEARGHPLAEAVFSVPGVARLYILGDFMTITKSPQADWQRIGPVIQARLITLLNGR